MTARRSITTNCCRAGPSVFAIAEGRGRAEEVAAALEREFGEFYCGFAVGEAGVKMRIDLVE